jgi:hypothetical protein
MHGQIAILKRNEEVGPKIDQIRAERQTDKNRTNLIQIQFRPSTSSVCLDVGLYM